MLNIENVWYSYNKNSGVAEIAGVSLHVRKGECAVFCGRSGSGKTTMTKLINSLIPNYYETGELTGSVLVSGIDTAKSPIYEVSQGVSSVFQNPKTQFFNVNTTSEILFYLENRGIERAVMKEKLAETAGLFGIGHLLDRDIFELSGGEKQIIAIAAAYASGTDIILLDEPSSNLDEEKTRLMGTILAALKKLGKTIIISEHRFYYIKDIIDTVYYIDAGKIHSVFTREEFFALSEEKRKALGLRSIEFEELILKKSSVSACTDTGQKQIHIKKIYHPFTGLNRALDIENVSFNLGSIVGIYGKNGIGKSTFIKILMGLQKARKAEIFINGMAYSGKKRLRISYLVMQDVNHQLFTDAVETECMLGKKEAYTEKDVERVLTMLNIFDLKDKHPMSLSGGQKQRTAIASAILSGAQIICFDEPTSGMDYDNMMRISQLIKNTVNDEILIFIISHDYEFLNSTADEVIDLSKFNRQMSGC